MATASERYRKHAVWETLTRKREALAAARFGDKRIEQLRLDVAEWLSEAEKTKATRQPSLYIGVLDELSNPLNGLPTTEAEFARYVSSGQ